MSAFDVAFRFISSSIDAHGTSLKEKPIVIGISGPQGSGKSYLTKELHMRIQGRYLSLSVVLFLMDDLYLTHSEQSALSEKAREDNNLLLQGRGLPGTHDVALGLDIFQRLVYSSSDSNIIIPTYDKGAFNGEGDRLDSSSWIYLKERPSVIIFEGWFNGFLPLDDDQIRLSYLSADDQESSIKKHAMFQIEDINERLKAYSKIWEFFDYFIFIESSLDNILNWRLEQEHWLIKNSPTGMGMSDDEVRKFVERYMPVYKVYYKRMCLNGLIKDREKNLRLCIDEERKLISYQVF